MRIFVAGASGAIGRPLIAELIRRGLRGASNQKAKQAFDFEPRRLEWLGR